MTPASDVKGVVLNADLPRRVTVRLLKQRRPAVGYEGLLIADDGTHLVIDAPWCYDQAIDLGVVCFQVGDVFTEHYWRDRWYSVKEVRDADRVRKGWYCDISRPAVLADDVLTSADLDLDLWVSADRREIVRLDEDEFLASDLRSEDPTTFTAALAAVQTLEELAIAAAYPFDK